MSKIEVKNKVLYWALIGTFTALYLAVAFVSTLHAVTFFQLANTLGLAILLGAAYEIGQAAVLFSILMTDNKNRMLAWAMMFLLTALQITANVYASFKFMDMSGSTDWTYWQRAILFGVQADSPETYKVIISWISGALLPIVALGMTALVAENIRMARGEKLGEEEDDDSISKEKADEIVENEVQRRLAEIKEKENSTPWWKRKKKEEIKPPSQEEVYDWWKNQEEKEKTKESTEMVGDALGSNVPISEEREGIIKDTKFLDLDDNPTAKEVYPPVGKSSVELIQDAEKLIDQLNKEKKEDPAEKLEEKKPVNKIRGWHFSNEYVDDEHNVFKKGKFIGNDPNKTPTSKKA